jgi:hypothetical protein
MGKSTGKSVYMTQDAEYKLAREITKHVVTKYDRDNAMVEELFDDKVRLEVDIRKEVLARYPAWDMDVLEKYEMTQYTDVVFLEKAGVNKDRINCFFDYKREEYVPSPLGFRIPTLSVCVRMPRPKSTLARREALSDLINWSSSLLQQAMAFLDKYWLRSCEIEKVVKAYMDTRVIPYRTSKQIAYNHPEMKPFMDAAGIMYPGSEVSTTSKSDKEKLVESFEADAD